MTCFPASKCPRSACKVFTQTVKGFKCRIFEISNIYDFSENEYIQDYIYVSVCVCVCVIKHIFLSNSCQQTYTLIVKRTE